MDWKRLLGFSPHSFLRSKSGGQVLGLDIGSSAVKIVRLRKDNAGYAVTAAGVVDITDGTESSENHQEINTARAIHDWLQGTGIQTKMAVCSVYGPEVAVRDFKFPSLPPREIEGAVLLEAAQVCPFDTKRGAVDYQLISDGGDKTSGVLVAATNALIKRKTQLAKQAHLNCVLMDVDGLALLNCFNECERREAGQAAAILNVGSSYTTVAITGASDLPFVRDMPYAGDDIVEQIATENAMSTETVKEILCDNSSVTRLELHDSLEKACEKLIADVAETLRYYAGQEKSASVEKIFVCGGFALVKEFVELLSMRLPAEAVLWNPFDKIPCDVSQQCEDILANRGPAMAVAAGLAMRSI